MRIYKTNVEGKPVDIVIVMCVELFLAEAKSFSSTQVDCGRLLLSAAFLNEQTRSYKHCATAMNVKR